MENSTKKIFETIFQCIFGLFEFPIKTWEKFRNDKYCKILQKLLIYLCTALAWWPGGSLLLDPGRSSRVLAAALLHLGLAAAGGDGADHPGRHPLHVHVKRPQVTLHHEPKETHKLHQVASLRHPSRCRPHPRQRKLKNILNLHNTNIFTLSPNIFANML